MSWAKFADNASDYSMMNTAKQMVWLPTTPEEEYMGKQAIDGFFVRAGDLAAALLVFLGDAWLHLSMATRLTRAAGAAAAPLGG